MRRILAALGCVAFISVIACSSAHAIIFRERKVRFITTQGPTPAPDRDAICRTAATVAASTAQPIDTTAWIPLWEGFAYNNTVVSLADTLGNAFFEIYPAAGTTAGATVLDTLSITAQASIDGFTPVAVTLTWGPQGLETSSNNCIYMRLSPGRSAVISGTAPSELTLGPYRFIRFIVVGDESGCFEAVWRYQSPENWTPSPPGIY